MFSEHQVLSSFFEEFFSMVSSLLFSFLQSQHPHASSLLGLLLLLPGCAVAAHSGLLLLLLVLSSPHILAETCVTRLF